MLRLILIFWVTNLFAQESKSFDYAYDSKKGICIYSLSDNKEKVVSHGDWPYISPDGTQLTYTETLPNRNRNICIINLTTKQKRVLNVGSNQSFGPVWSPDGHFIAYNVLYNEGQPNGQWKIDIIETASNRTFEITKNIKKDCYSPSWSADSKKLLVHDLDSIFILDVEGDILNRYKIKEFGGSSADNCILTSDKKQIIFTGTVDETKYSAFGEPLSAIFIYDIAKGSTKRLTPVGLDCMNLFLNDSTLFFNGHKANSKRDEVFSLNLADGAIKDILKDCSIFTCRRKKNGS